jgi:hypothetical protein
MKREKPLLRRQPGRPKDVFMVGDMDGTILRIYTTIELAAKHTPANGSVTPITPVTLEKHFGGDVIVIAWLAQYEMEVTRNRHY